MEWLFVDGSYIKAHQDSTEVVVTEKVEDLGKNCAGVHSRTHLAVDTYGLTIAFRFTGGDVHGSTEAQKLIYELPTGYTLVTYAHREFVELSLLLFRNLGALLHFLSTFFHTLAISAVYFVVAVVIRLSGKC